MHLSHLRGGLLVAIAAAPPAGGAAAADGPPPLPKPTNGAAVTALARGLPLPSGVAIG